jgi:hypothetical protein
MQIVESATAAGAPGKTKDNEALTTWIMASVKKPLASCATALEDNNDD